MHFTSVGGMLLERIVGSNPLWLVISLSRRHFSEYCVYADHGVVTPPVWTSDAAAGGAE